MINKNKIFKKLIEIFILLFILIVSNIASNIKNERNIKISLLKDEKLYVLPENNAEIYNFIQGAKSSIDITIYMLSDNNIKKELIDKKKSGVNIRIIIEKTPFGGGSLNYKTYNELTSYGINIKYSNPEFSLTHAKYIIIDKDEVLIMTSNLTHSGLNDDRDFIIYENDIDIINELNTLFEKDFTYNRYSSKNSNLIISPNNSRLRIESLIKSAKSDIKMYIENINDDNIFKLLVNSLNSGVNVSIIAPDSKKVESNSEILNKLKTYGALISYLKKPYQHAKVLIIDNTVMYVGSINFSEQSMEENREVGVITVNKNNINVVLKTFEKDFKIR